MGALAPRLLTFYLRTIVLCPLRGPEQISKHSELSCRTEETLSGSSGVVARHHKGNFISATTWVLPHVRSAESAEPSAIRNGLYLAGGIGWNKVYIESDSILAVEAVTRAHDYMGPDVAVIAECIQLTLNFASIDYGYCCREANVVADSLAKLSFVSCSSELWDSNILDFILPHSINDMSII